MDRFRSNHPLFGFVVGLCLMGSSALTGLVLPIATGYLSEKPLAGGLSIQTTAPLVRVRFVQRPSQVQLLQGRDMTTPACMREPGLV